MINRIFDCVFVINLDRAPDRLKRIDLHLKRLGIKYERIQAVDGKTLTKNEIRASTTKHCGMFCTKGAIGCALSHKAAWKLAVDRRLKQFLVLEDDAHLTKDFNNRFTKIWQHVPNDWDMVYLGCTTGCGDRKDYTALDWGMTGAFMTNSFIKNKQSPKQRYVNEHICVPDSASATHAYALTGSAAATLISRMDKVSGFGHVDQLITYEIGRDLTKYAFVDGSIITQPLSFDDSFIGGGGSPFIGNILLDQSN